MQQELITKWDNNNKSFPKISFRSCNYKGKVAKITEGLNDNMMSQTRVIKFYN